MKDITDKSKSDKTMTEISGTLSTDALTQFQEIAQNRQSPQSPAAQNTDHQGFLNQSQCLVDSVREQHMTSDYEIQNTLNQASTTLLDSQRLSKLYTDAKELHQAAMLGLSNLQTNMPEYKQTLEQMVQDCHTQQVATDMQVIGALQQSISAMATAQNCLLQSQAVDKIFKDINKCESSLKQIEKAK